MTKPLNHLGKPWLGPQPYVVYCEVRPTKTNGLKKPHIHRVSGALSVEHAREQIEKDKLAMRDSYGGLLPVETIKNRRYQIFKVTFETVE